MTTVAAAAAATTAALQKPPATFHPHSHLSFTGGLRLPNLTFKLKLKTKSRRSGGCTATKMVDSAAGNYAATLAEVATANGTLDATTTDFEKIDKIFSDDTVLNFFISPIVSLEKKRELIDDITSSGSLQLHVCNFLNILIESKRIDLVREIVKEFEVKVKVNVNVKADDDGGLVICVFKKK